MAESMDILSKAAQLVGHWAAKAEVRGFDSDGCVRLFVCFFGWFLNVLVKS